MKVRGFVIDLGEQAGLAGHLEDGSLAAAGHGSAGQRQQLGVAFEMHAHRNVSGYPPFPPSPPLRGRGEQPDPQSSRNPPAPPTGASNRRRCAPPPAAIPKSPGRAGGPVASPLPRSASATAGRRRARAA